VAVLGAKAPDELDAYRRLVLDVATAAAEAKGGVKDEETAAIAKITQALGGA
jgi:tellurite resistance protein